MLPFRLTPVQRMLRWWLPKFLHWILNAKQGRYAKWCSNVKSLEAYIIMDYELIVCIYSNIHHPSVNISWPILRFSIIRKSTSVYLTGRRLPCMTLFPIFNVEGIHTNVHKDKSFCNKWHCCKCMPEIISQHQVN